MYQPPLDQRLIETSLVYVQARRSFELVVSEARSVGLDDDEIAHRVGLSRTTIELVAGKPRP